MPQNNSPIFIVNAEPCFWIAIPDRDIPHYQTELKYNIETKYKNWKYVKVSNVTGELILLVLVKC